MIEILQYPSTDVGDGQISKWSAVHNPIVYIFQRKDYSVASITQTSGQTQITLSSVPSDIIVGDTLYVYSGSGVYDGQCTVEAVNGAVLDVDLTYVSDTSDGFANLLTGARENYVLEIGVYGKSGSTYTLIATMEATPDSTGLINADVAGFLKRELNFDNDFDYDVISEADYNLGLKFNIDYTEVWSGFLSDVFTESAEAASAIDDTNDLYAVNSAQQIQDLYGSNMGAYVPFPPDVTPSPGIEQNKGAFLSDFQYPVYFVGYPFDVCWIFPELFGAANMDVAKYETRRDVNGIEVSAQGTMISEGGQEAVNRLMLDGSYTSDIRSVDLYLKAMDCYVYGGYVEDDYVDCVEPPALTTSRVSEIKTVDVDHTCYDNPIYLCWHNLHGGKSYWLFHTAYTEGLQVDGVERISRYNADWSTAHTVKDWLSKRAFKELVIGANNLSRDKIEGLKGLLTSIRVQVLVSWNTPDAPVWLTVLVKPGSFRVIDATENKSNIEITLEYPDMNLPTQ